MKHKLFASANGAEDVARLRQKVENRAADAESEGRRVIDDVQLENPKDESQGCIYLTATTSDDGKDLVFIAERCIYNPAIDDNVPLGAETFRANSFSEWFAAKPCLGCKQAWRMVWLRLGLVAIAVSLAAMAWYRP